MPRHATIALGMIGLVAFGSCAPKQSVSPVVVQQPVAPADVDVSADKAEPITHDVQAASDSPTSANSLATATDGRADDNLHAPERILLLAPGGPLLVDVWLTIDRQPHVEVFDALVERVLSAGDTDRDGRPTWSEWRANQEFLEGDLASLSSNRNRVLRNWIERYDENDDNVIQRPEAMSWLGRDSGRSAAALTLRSSRSYVALPWTTSRVWQLLDVDGSRWLSSDEIDSASIRMLSLDADDDRIVMLPELASLREQLEAQSPQRMSMASRSTRHAARHLKNRDDTNRLDYLLSNLYAPRQQLGPDSFSERTELFTALDSDGDQFLDSQELALLLEIEPHVELSVDFVSDDATSPAAASVKLLKCTSEIRHAAQFSANRVVLATSDARLIISAHDLAGNQNANQITQRSQLRSMVHDRCDGLFEKLDANSDGRLGEREIAAAPARLRDCDADGNRQLNADEVPYAMIVAFLRSEPASEQSFYVPGSVTAPVNQSTTPAWFRHTDFNRDGDVSPREFIGSRAQFSVLDANQDGYISGDEVADDELP